MLLLTQQLPLLISTLIGHPATCRGEREIVSRDPEGACDRANFAGVASRGKSLSL